MLIVSMETDNRRDATGVSLISTLVVLVTLGAMSAIVFSALSKGESKSTKETKALLDELNAPTPAGQAAAGAAAEADMAGASAARPPSLAGMARTSACKANVGVLQAATATKHASDGAWPASVDELVAGHWIDSAPSTAGYHITLEVVGGQPTGQVLVNGRPGAQGCDGPAQP